MRGGATVLAKCPPHQYQWRDTNTVQLGAVSHHQYLYGYDTRGNKIIRNCRVDTYERVTKYQCSSCGDVNTTSLRWDHNVHSECGQ